MTLLIKRFAAACLISATLGSYAGAQDKTVNSVASEDELISISPKAAPDHIFTAAPGDHTVGEADAPNTLIIYASVTCPHCSMWFKEDWPQIKKDYVETGKLKVVMREFLTQPQQLAVAGFMIANCAPEGEFMNLVEHQMENQEHIFERAQAGEGQQVYLEIAKLAGLESEAEMTGCFEREEEFNHIVLSMDRAEAAGVDSVPNFFLNGEKLVHSGRMLQALQNLDQAKMSVIPQ